MSDESPAARVHRGMQAQMELPLTRAALKAIRQHLLEAIAATPFEDQDGRERLYLSIQLLEPVETLLVQFVTDGVVAQSELDTAEHLRAATQGRQPN